MKLQYLTCVFLLVVSSRVQCQSRNGRVGSLQEVFAWTQLTYDLNGYPLTRDLDSLTEIQVTRSKRGLSRRYPGLEDDWGWPGPQAGVWDRPDERNRWDDVPRRPPFIGPVQTNRPRTSQRPNPQAKNLTILSQFDLGPRERIPNNDNRRDNASRFFIQYNNVPMGVERVGDRLFVTVPRRQNGIASTINYINLTQSEGVRSPPLRPYPDFQRSRTYVNIYRTRADVCGRLWAVDTGLIEVPGAPRLVQAPSLIIFDLNTDEEVYRYQFKSSDIPSNRTATGLAAIAVEVPENSCEDAFAYIPDLATYGIIVFSLRDRDSWRIQHNYFYFNPILGDFNVAGQNFQWNDGIFSIALGASLPDGCRVAYFHALASYHEFSVSTCVLRNMTAQLNDEFWTQFNILGERGMNSQSITHDYHPGTRTLFFAEIGRDAVSCWNTGSMLQSSNVVLLAQDSVVLSYPADIHITGDEAWVVSNRLPRFIYSRIDVEDENFFIFRGNVHDMIRNTPCSNGLRLTTK